MSVLLPLSVVNDILLHLVSLEEKVALAGPFSQPSDHLIVVPSPFIRRPRMMAALANLRIVFELRLCMMASFGDDYCVGSRAVVNEMRLSKSRCTSISMTSSVDLFCRYANCRGSVDNGSK